MRIVPAVIAMLLAGCEGGPINELELELEITVEADAVRLNAYDVHRRFDCNQKAWVELGDCDGTTDAWGCETEGPGSCISSLRVEEAGVVIADGVYEPIYQSGYFQVPGAATRELELVVEGCGGEARVPLPPRAPPVPTLLDVVDDGTTLEVTWSGDTATASGVVGWSDGYGGPRCHVAAGEPATLRTAEPEPTFFSVYVTAYTAPVEHDTELGVARVRSSGDGRQSP